MAPYIVGADSIRPQRFSQTARSQLAAKNKEESTMMKVCVIQPPYSTEYEKSDAYFQYELDLLDQCDSTMDLIVMPESCDIPCLAKTKEQAEKSVKKYNAALLQKASETAKRCGAVVFVNARSETDKGYRNTTYAFDREGKEAGRYDKQHLVASEVSVMELDSAYSFEHSAPTVLEIDGIRFGFLICYDFYFYENFSNLARQNLDVIIGCSHQRSDTHSALALMTRFLAYNTNTYVIRSSVALNETEEIGGASMIAAPDGEILLHMHNETGLQTAEIDVHKKYVKPAGYGNAPAAHNMLSRADVRGNIVLREVQSCSRTISCRIREFARIAALTPLPPKTVCRHSVPPLPWARKKSNLICGIPKTEKSYPFMTRRWNACPTERDWCMNIPMKNCCNTISV